MATDAELTGRAALVEGRVGDDRDLWLVLPPVAVATANGSRSEPQPDGSLLFVGPRPDTDIYTLTLESPHDGITALRLEVLTDESLPHHGPGRQDNGNLKLSEFKISVLAEPGDAAEAGADRRRHGRLQPAGLEREFGI